MKTSLRIFIATLCSIAASADAQWLPAGQTTGPIYYQGGSVGIGTSTPAQRLEVVGRLRLTDAGFFGELFSGSSGGLNALHLGSISAVPLAFYTNSSAPQMVLQNTTGNVGIGTMAPAQKLHVVGTARISSGDLYLDNDRVIRAGSGDQALMYRASTNGIFVGSGDLNDFLVFNSGGTEKVRIATSGNVGIGTAQPIQKLHVEGNIHVSGVN